uniref:MCMDC2 N-terminal domain-containing protein n=1 Tax=Anguilla anguilla TaxID=7936 RepID=A0A0E9V2U5_ANGAN
MAELLEMKEAIVSYLDRSGGLLQFVDDCKLYNGEVAETLELSTTRLNC